MKQKFKQSSISAAIRPKSSLLNREVKFNVPAFSLPVEKEIVFTEEDYLLIDWVHQENTGPKGDFSMKIKNRLCCWEVHYIVRTIPGIYFSTPELEKETLETIDTHFDEYELFYVHRHYCDHREIGPILAHILNGFLDNGTHLLAAQAKLIPVSIPDFIKKHGPNAFQNIDASQPIQITYEWDQNHQLNWDFLERPLTSSPYPYLKK